MNKAETKLKEPYETPELLDIKPVTILTVRGDPVVDSDTDPNDIE